MLLLPPMLASVVQRLPWVLQTPSTRLGCEARGPAPHTTRPKQPRTNVLKIGVRMLGVNAYSVDTVAAEVDAADVLADVVDRGTLTGTDQPDGADCCLKYECVLVGATCDARLLDSVPVPLSPPVPVAVLAPEVDVDAAVGVVAARAVYAPAVLPGSPRPMSASDGTSNLPERKGGTTGGRADDSVEDAAEAVDGRCGGADVRLEGSANEWVIPRHIPDGVAMGIPRLSARRMTTHLLAR